MSSCTGDEGSVNNHVSRRIQEQQSGDGRVRGLQNKAKGKWSSAAPGLASAHRSFILASKNVGPGKERRLSTYPYAGPGSMIHGRYAVSSTRERRRLCFAPEVAWATLT